MAADQHDGAGPGPQARPVTEPLFSERLRVPTRWWLYAALAVISVLLAGAAALDVPVALLLAACTALAVVAGLVTQSSFTVRVGPDGLHVGAAHLPPWAVGDVRALDRAQVRRVRGAESDPRAYYPTRSYVPTAVRVDVADGSDPVPFWLVSSRRPAELVRALEGVRGDAAEPDQHV
jgi:hypothetical protein